jgi:hypothetical protein
MDDVVSGVGAAVSAGAVFVCAVPTAGRVAKLRTTRRRRARAGRRFMARMEKEKGRRFRRG